MTAFLLSIGPALAKFAAICAAIIGALWAIRRDARKDARQETALEAAERYAKTLEKMDAVDTGNDDPAVLREWLRERGKQ